MQNPDICSLTVYLFTSWVIHVVRQEDELYVGFLCYLGDDLRTVYSWQQPDCELWPTGQGCCHRSQVWQAWQWEKLCYRRWQGERERERVKEKRRKQKQWESLQIDTEKWNYEEEYTNKRKWKWVGVMDCLKIKKKRRVMFYLIPLT